MIQSYRIIRKSIYENRANNKFNNIRGERKHPKMEENKTKEQNKYWNKEERKHSKIMRSSILTQ